MLRGEFDSKRSHLILSPHCPRAAWTPARRRWVQTSGIVAGTPRERPFLSWYTWTNPINKTLCPHFSSACLTPYCWWWGKLGCWAAAQRWNLPHIPLRAAAMADGISAPPLPRSAWRNPRGRYSSLPHLLNALTRSARGLRSALEGPVCQCHHLTIEQRHVEDQLAPAFRNPRASIQVRRNPHLSSEMTTGNPFWSGFQAAFNLMHFLYLL